MGKRGMEWSDRGIKGRDHRDFNYTPNMGKETTKESKNLFPLFYLSIFSIEVLVQLFLGFLETLEGDGNSLPSPFPQIKNPRESRKASEALSARTFIERERGAKERILYLILKMPIRQSRVGAVKP